MIDFYKRNKNHYTIIKPEWVLSKEQCDYISNVLSSIKKRSEEAGDGDVYICSTSASHYAIQSKNYDVVFYDREGKWRKYSEINDVLGIKSTMFSFPLNILLIVNGKAIRDKEQVESFCQQYQFLHRKKMRRKYYQRKEAELKGIKDVPNGGVYFIDFKE